MNTLTTQNNNITEKDDQYSSSNLDINQKKNQQDFKINLFKKYLPHKYEHAEEDLQFKSLSQKV